MRVWIIVDKEDIGSKPHADYHDLCAKLMAIIPLEFQKRKFVGPRDFYFDFGAGTVGVLNEESLQPGDMIILALGSMYEPGLLESFVCTPANDALFTLHLIAETFSDTV